MSPDETLHALGAHFGIHDAFHDFSGAQHLTSNDTRRAILRALGVDVSSDAAVAEQLSDIRARSEHRWFPEEVIIDAGHPNDLPFGLGATWRLLRWQDRAEIAEGQAGDHITLPALAPDVYELEASVAGRVEHVRVLSAPDRLPDMRDGRHWGLTAALYGLTSARSMGLGDYADLAELCAVAAGAGAGFVGINPVHDMGFACEKAISPYSPSHRGFYNTNHIALDAIPGLETVSEAKAILAQTRKMLSDARASETVQYHQHRQAHQAALVQLYDLFLSAADAGTVTDFRSFIAASGPTLARFARYENLSETHGDDWWSWPSKASPACDRTEFHAWLQWICDRQLGKAAADARAAGLEPGLYLDLAVGPRRNGGESWCEQDSIANGISIGAPPDHLGPEGQNWDLAAYAPHKLQTAGYGPLRSILSATMRHAGLVRIDHVLGLNRSFWIPDDGSPGTYISQPFDALLAIIKIEALRAGTAVVGEDLGLVPDGFRETMQNHGFYGYSVLQYEKSHDGFRDPRTGQSHVLSCFATHDTPTIAGFVAARDIDWWEKLDILGAPEAENARATRKQDVAALTALDDGTDTNFTAGMHRLLAASAADLVSVQLDDVQGVTEAQNLPGTIDEHPNWRRRYPTPLEDMPSEGSLDAVGEIMKQQGRMAQGSSD